VERATRDPHDDYLVALAKAAGAVLVSSDRDVLEADIGDLEVLNACEFLDRLGLTPSAVQPTGCSRRMRSSRLRRPPLQRDRCAPDPRNGPTFPGDVLTSDSICGCGAGRLRMHRRLAIASCRRNDRRQSPVRAAVTALAQEQSRYEQRWPRLLLVPSGHVGITPASGTERACRVPACRLTWGSSFAVEAVLRRDVDPVDVVLVASGRGNSAPGPLTTLRQEQRGNRGGSLPMSIAQCPAGSIVLGEEVGG
jgi:hypothetical protein